ncbi:hypothetical protein AD998_04010 [bacterium 336/3]|nr:hypothetical protein AD998_04010 [bacterium 336/3]
MKKIIFLIVLLFCFIQGFSQRFSTNPDEFIGQIDKILRESNQIKSAEQIRSAWTRGAFTTDQQTKIIILSQKIVNKRGKVDTEIKNLLEAFIGGLEGQTVTSNQLDNLLMVSDKLVSTASLAKINVFSNRINSLLLYKALYSSNFNKIYVDGGFEFVYADSSVRNQNSWFKDWKEASREPDSLGNIQPYPHPLVVGPVILFPKTNLYFSSPHDSVSITNTKIAFFLELDMFVADKGRFSWENLYNKGTVDSIALGNIQRKNIYVDFDKFSHKVTEQRIKAENVSISYSEKLKNPEKGSFEFLSEKRKNMQDLRFPIFKSYSERTDIQNIGTNISYTGGMKMVGLKLYGYSPSKRPNCRLLVTKDGEVKFHANSKEIYLGDDQILSKNTSFGYYISGSDSLTHSDVVLSYNKIKLPNDSTPANAFKLYKEKVNDDIPFIDEYHKMYIIADMAIYQPEKNIVDFYIVGANTKIPAIFESFSYFDGDRYEEIHGSYNFHPLKLVQYYAGKYGSTNSQGVREFNIAAIFDDLSQQNNNKKKQQSKIDPNAVKMAMRKLSREGYVAYDEFSGSIIVLNRTTQSANSYQYKRAMEYAEKNPKKKLPIEFSSYADKDFDDMIIESISPRNARKDSIKVDTIKFKFNQGRILYPKLEGKDVYITKRVFKPKTDSISRDTLFRDTTITLTDTFKIDRFTEVKKVILGQELEVNHLNPNNFVLLELDGFFTQGDRKKGPYMPNATIDANGGGIVIRGIERFAVSKKLNLNFIPKNKEIRIFGDRVIMMEEGEVTVGNFRFIGKNFTLPYDEFKLTMETIDTVLFAVQDPKNPQLKYDLGGEIKMNAGDLYINHPNNKSGLKKGQIPGGKKGETYESFPKLKVETGGRIYFDAFYREKFAYHKKQVYFEIPNVELDSLTSKLPKFSGVFHSNIFPPIKEELVPVYDPKYNGIESKYALGFVHRPKKSLKLYSKHGEIKADSIVMYKTGLVASGKNLEIKNHTYSVKARSVVLTPDSVHTENATLEVKQGFAGKTLYPKASGENLRLAWFTSKDSVQIDSITFKNRDKLFKLFDDKNPASLKGTLAITPESLWGIGELSRKDFFLFAPKGVKVSPERIFTPDIPDNIVEFKVNSTDKDPFAKEEVETNKPLIDANAIFIDFDLKKSICKITYNKTIAQQNPNYDFISFPYAQFKTSVKEAVWDVAKKNVTMHSDSASMFASTKFAEEENTPQKDIIFKAKGGKYDLKDINNPILELLGVDYIPSADARIIPNKGKVTILKGADIQELKDATIVVDTINFYHTLVHGNIKINHREDFEGDATYRYVNVIKDTTKIKFDKFELVGRDSLSEAGVVKKKRRKKDLDTLHLPSRYTQSQGEVLETDNFFITSRIQFKGKAEMLAYKKDLILDGSIRLSLKSRKDFDSWIPYQRDAGDVYIELDEKTSVEDKILTSGLHYAGEAGKLYTTFLSSKKEDLDGDLFLTKGVLSYVPELNEFKITDKARLEKESYQGSLFTFDDSKATIEMQGKFNMVDEALQKNVFSSGNVKINLKKDDYQFNQFFVMDFSKFKSAFAVMGDMLNLNKMDGGEAAYSTEDVSLMSKLAEIVGDSKAKKYETTARTKFTPLFNADKKLLAKGIVLSNVNMHWSDTTNSFYSVGKIGVANVLDKDLNSLYEGYLEIQKMTDGDILTLYIEGANDMWFYFSFHQGTLYGESSVDKFNNIFSKGKKAKKVGELSMEIADDGAAQAFKAKFKHYYIDKKLGAVPETPRKDKEEKEEEEEPKEEKKSKKKKKKKGDEEEEENIEPKEEEPKEEEKPKEEKKSKKKKKKKGEEEEDEENVEPKEEEPKEEEKPKDEKKKDEKVKEEKPKDEKEKPKEEKEKPKDEKKKDEKVKEEKPKDEKEKPKEEKEKPKDEKKKDEKKPKDEKEKKPTKDKKKKKKGEEDEEDEPRKEEKDEKDGF